MLIQLYRHEWEEIRAMLQNEGKLSRLTTPFVKEIEFPRRINDAPRLCAGGQR